MKSHLQFCTPVEGICNTFTAKRAFGRRHNLFLKLLVLGLMAGMASPAKVVAQPGLPADLAATITANPQAAGPGDKVDFNVSVTNNGPENAKSPVLTAVIPGFFDPGSFRVTGKIPKTMQATFDTDTRVFTLTVGADMPPGSTQGTSISFNAATENVTGPVAEIILNAASPTTDPDPNNNNDAVSITVLTGNAGLSSLTSTAGTLSPAFVTGTYSYTTSIVNTTAVMTVVPTTIEADATIQVRVNGGGYATVASGEASADLPLNEGLNNIEILVTAQGGVFKTYKIAATWTPLPADMVASIEVIPEVVDAGQAAYFTLSITNNGPGTAYAPALQVKFPSYFNPGSFSILEIIPDAVEGLYNNESLTLSYPSLAPGGMLYVRLRFNTTLDSVGTADIVLSTTSSTLDTNPDNNKDTVSVKIVSGLAGLTTTIDELSPAFATDIYAYTAYVPPGTASITVTPTVAETNATAQVRVNGGDYAAVVSGETSADLPLILGDNTIEILVTTADGNRTKTYTLTVIRGAGYNTLSNLTISPGTLEFSPETTVYYINDVTTNKLFTITPTATSPTATITVNGVPVLSGNPITVTLTKGQNIFNVTVTPIEGESKTYTMYYPYYGNDNNAIELTMSPRSILTKVISGPADLNYTTSVDINTATVRVKSRSADKNAMVYVNGTIVPRNTFSDPIPLTDVSTVINITALAENNEIQTHSITVNRTGSNNTNVAIKLSTKTELPKTTGPAQTDYFTTVDPDENAIRVTPKTEDKNATVTVNGQVVPRGSKSGLIDLTGPVTLISVVVTAQDGTTKSYSISVRKSGSNNARMSFSVSGKPVLIDAATGPAQLNYTTSVDQNTTEVRITPKAEDDNSTIVIGSETVANNTPSSPIALMGASTTVYMMVTAQDGVTIRTYSVIIAKNGSNNAKLRSIMLNLNSTVTKTGGIIDGAIIYSGSVDATATQIMLKPTAEEKNAAILVNGIPVNSGAYSGPIALNDGPTNINIQVTAQNGGTQNYLVIVNRDGSNNVRLKSVVLSPAAVVTEVSGTSYHATVSEASVRVKATPESPDAMVEVNGVPQTGGYSAPVNLNDGANQIMILVKGQNMAEKTYTLTVTRSSGNLFSTNSKLSQAQTGVTVNPAVSPNGDGINDVLNIAGIEAYPENTLQVMNSKGVRVITITGYDNHTKVFDGRNQSGTPEPGGMYFYMLTYKAGAEARSKSGYVVLKY